MAKFIERIVDSMGEPLENDLWLRWKNGKPTISAWDGDEWVEMAGEGGGGGSEDAITYNEQELTDEQKMQARKNQDLYYSETVPEQTISWDGTITDRDWFEFKEGNEGGSGELT